MKVRIRRFFPLLLAMPCHAGWEIREIPSKDHVAVERIVISAFAEPERGLSTLDDALSKLAQNGTVAKLTSLNIHSFVKDADFQKEIFARMEEIAPEDFAAAKRSAGNMHNPKMQAIAQAFDQAVLQTPTVRKFQKSLSKHGLVISKVSHEKLSLTNDAGERKFHCFLWLAVSPK